MISLELNCVRLGPSASAASGGRDRDDYVLAALETLKDLATNPDIRAMMANALGLGPTGGTEDKEVASARRGEPASSRPGKPSGPTEDVKVEDVASAKGSDKPIETKTVPPPSDAASKTKSDPPNPSGNEEESPEEVINSSTHRKEHARLTRRMQSVDPATCPEMSRLWSNGTRQDGFQTHSHTQLDQCFKFGF